jgi:SAM-dependent methyltransferase
VDRDPHLESAGNHVKAGDGGATPTRPRLSRIAVPTLVVHGTADPLFPLAHGQALAAEIPGAELLTLPGVGHQVPPSTWDTLLPAILRLSSGGWPEQADRLAALSIAAGDPTGWFDQLYGAASAGEVEMPWDRGVPNPLLVDWARGRDGAGRRAVVVGCGLGREAGYLASLGYATVGFDVSETVVKLARERVPGVDFQVADLFELPPGWAFDLVVEIYTVQAMPRSHREAATRAVRELVAPGGTLFTLFARVDEPDEDGPPWPLTRPEIEAFGTGGLETVHIGQTDDPPRWVAEFRRP